MKFLRKHAISMLLCLFLSMFMVAIAPTIMAGETERTTVSIIGVRADGEDTRIGISGGIRLSKEQNIWGFGSTALGKDYQTAELQFAKFLISNDKINIGILASPISADWLENPATNDVTTYFTGFGGVVGNFWFNKNTSIYAVVEWKFDYDAENELYTKQGWMWQAGIAFDGLTLGLGM